MIGYITLGTNNMARSATFYDALFDCMGVSRTLTEEAFIAWGKGDGSAMFSIHVPHDKHEATVGNGVMIALQLAQTTQVDELHEMALSLGAQNEGDPGYRMDGFYAAYFRDLDGNKLNLHVMEG